MRILIKKDAHEVGQWVADYVIKKIADYSLLLQNLLY